MIINPGYELPEAGCVLIPDCKTRGHFKRVRHGGRTRIQGWISRDPIGEAGGINLFGYASNNPVSLVDPLGLDSVDLADQLLAAYEANPGASALGLEAGVALNDATGGNAPGGGTPCPGKSGNKDANGYTSSNSGGGADISVGNLMRFLGQGALAAVNIAAMFSGLGEAEIAAETEMTTVGRWMSQTEYEAMVNTGRIQESTLNGITSVTSPPNVEAWLSQTEGTHFVQFDVPSSAVRASDGLTAKIYGPNSIFGPKLGITEMPPATNIIHTATKLP